MEARLQIVTCNIRIVGGCMAGHVPWYVYIIIGITNKCGGVLINKFWVLSAAHCFCEKFPCSRVKDGNIEKWKIDYNISDPNRIKVTASWARLYLTLWSPQAYLGGDGNSLDTTWYAHAWKKEVTVVELVIHYKYKMRRTRGNRITERKDYDIALLRIEYPVMDEKSGNAYSTLDFRKDVFQSFYLF